MMRLGKRREYINIWYIFGKKYFQVSINELYLLRSVLKISSLQVVQTFVRLPRSPEFDYTRSKECKVYTEVHTHPVQHYDLQFSTRWARSLSTIL